MTVSHRTAPKFARTSKKQRAKAAPRRKAVPYLKRPLIRLSLTLTACAVIAGLGGWVWRTGLVAATLNTVEQTTVALSSQAGFTVRDVLIVGRREASKVDLRQALGLRQGMALLTFDPESARTRVEQLPWVASALIERRLPDTVFITIVERTPTALWQVDGEFSVIDADGEVIDGANLRKFAHLPLVVGADAPKSAHTVIALIKSHSALADRVRAAVRVSARRWTLTLTNGIEVHLPAHGAAAALVRLATYQKEYDLLSRDISTIDLRAPGRLVVRKRGQPAPSEPIDTNSTRGA